MLQIIKKTITITAQFWRRDWLYEFHFSHSEIVELLHLCRICLVQNMFVSTKSSIECQKVLLWEILLVSFKWHLYTLLWGQTHWYVNDPSLCPFRWRLLCLLEQNNCNIDDTLSVLNSAVTWIQFSDEN